MYFHRLKWILAATVSLLYLFIPYTLGVESDTKINDQLTFLINWIIVAVVSGWFVCHAKVKSLLELAILSSFVFYLFMLHQLVSYIPFSFYFSDGYIGDLYVMTEKLNLIPFYTIKDVFIHPLSETQYIIQVGGNLLLLLPFAFALRVFKFTGSLKQTVLCTMLISIGIESFQFVLNLLASGHAEIKASGKSRAIDIDDVILNTLSGYLGSLLFTVYKRFAVPKRD